MICPRHHHARLFVERGVFDNLYSFSELEARISELPTTQDRGNAFEVFAEAYLATQKLTQADDVWPFDAVPVSVLQKMAIDTPRDLGVDGVYKGLDGSLNAYQVKFRTNRPSLDWRALSTFMGLTDQVSQRLLFTNCDDLPPVMNDRTGFHCIRGTDLDRLTRDDLDLIGSWLRGTPSLPVLKTPRPYQTEALEEINAGLDEGDRATAVMACGTGKTLVALWLAEQRNAHRVLVLVPSLALVRQTLHEWLKETRWPAPRFIAVCSDPTVTGDALIVRQSDLDFPVTTDADVVRRFLKDGTGGVSVVFSTYQSAQVVGQANTGLPGFDLGIFDEAHKTAGREGAKFGYALKDENIVINNRVFLTATPRHYDVRKRDKEGDKKLVYSMDDQAMYGPIVHTLSFADAAARDIICDYKIIISIVTSKMVNDQLLRTGDVLIDGDEVRARTVATQIALQQACTKHDLKKVFSFHRNVASARDFTGETASSVRTHLPDYETLHVNGTMPTARREKTMQAFREADRAVISNARCLTEGVDVPAVDLVAFLSPRRSKVDIVQAAGRAMRKADPKERGYILLPLFLETAENETVDDALERTDFDEAWNVLQAMQEQDGVLIDIIRQMREDRGRRGGFDDSHLREKVEVLGPLISLEQLRGAVAIKLLDRLGVTWDERFGELEAFKKRNGHCRVPARWSENRQLAIWVNEQRTAKARGKISDERIERLEKHGFDWDVFASKWDEMYAELVQYEEKNGHCRVPGRWTEDPQLATWVQTQRSAKARGKLSVDQIERLNKLGFEWDPFASMWDEMYAELVQFREEYGHCRVPHAWPENPKLGRWVVKQRAAKAKDKLSVDQIERLNKLGFDWDPSASKWDEMYAELVQFREEYGHCRVPHAWPENSQLASWVETQRTAKAKGNLSTELIERLEKHGFEWDPSASKWGEMYAELARFHEEYGHCRVPHTWSENPKLGSWVSRQRRFREQGKLSSERIKRLDKLSFDWDPHAANWEAMFAELVRFKEKFAHCRVPAQWPENSQLGAWVRTQRKAKAIGTLSAEREARLEALGFKWLIQ